MASGPRNRFDLFLPEDTPKGLVVFVHGGYWVRFDKSYWSHLANGSVEHGYAVAMPSYTLCPQTRISGITTGGRRGDRQGGCHDRWPDPSDRPLGRRASGDADDLGDLAACPKRCARASATRFRFQAFTTSGR